jgi:AcrR family transcriptional regulator
MALSTADDARPAKAGRPRSEARDVEILDAAIQALVDEGFAAMTIEGIAARVGAGKATVYRRWNNKAELVAAAIQRHACSHVPLVDSGDVRADVREFLHGMLVSFRGIDGALMAVFSAERIRHPELGEAFDRQFVAERRAHLRRIIQRGVDTGDLPATTDVELLAAVGPAILTYELNHRRRLRADLADRIVAQFFPG